MAEIALILGSLGAAYIASNRNSNSNGNGAREGYRNAGKHEARYLPNTNIPTTNYPVIRPNTGSNVNDYKKVHEWMVSIKNGSDYKTAFKSTFGQDYDSWMRDTVAPYLNSQI